MKSRDNLIATCEMVSFPVGPLTEKILPLIIRSRSSIKARRLSVEISSALCASIYNTKYAY